MGLVARKPVFRVSDKARLKPASSATGTEVLLVASLDMIDSNKRITKALITLRVWAGWSEPLLFANLRRQVFSRLGTNMVVHKLMRKAMLQNKTAHITKPSDKKGTLCYIQN